MVRVYTSPSVVPCDLLKSILESEGIPCVIRNEYGTHWLGYGFPLPGGSELQWAWPEVWIREADVERAAPIVQDIERSQQENSSEASSRKTEA